MRITLPEAMRLGLLLAGLPAAAASGAVRAESPAPDRTAAADSVAAVPHPAVTAGGEDGRSQLSQATLEFGLYALGAKAFNITFTMRRQDAAVSVDTEMQTFGPLDFLMSFEMKGHAAAELRDGQILPVRYSTESGGSWSKRTTRITWDAGGMPVAEVKPPPDGDDRDPVPDELKRNTMDPTTAIVARALQTGSAPPCSGSDAIFDGRRRYNLHFSPLGPTTLEPHDRSAYAGPAFECLVRLEPIAGYRKGNDDDIRAIEHKETHLWLVRPPGIAAWIPVRLDSGFSLGNVTGWISSARLNGRDWLEPLPPIRVESPRMTTP